MRKEKTMLLKRGNSKLSRNILIFNLPPGKSCPNSRDCIKTCYAKKSYNQYPSCKKSWDDNLDMAKNNPLQLYNQLRDELTYFFNKGLQIVRVHSSGDFFSKAYAEIWLRLAQIFPKMRFYTYTKAEIKDLELLDNLKNFNLIHSKIDGKLNYGAKEHCIKLKKEFDCFICPDTKRAKKEKDKICGNSCHYCVTEKRPVFIQH